MKFAAVHEEKKYSLCESFATAQAALLPRTSTQID